MSLEGSESGYEGLWSGAFVDSCASINAISLPCESGRLNAMTMTSKDPDKANARKVSVFVVSIVHLDLLAKFSTSYIKTKYTFLRFFRFFTIFFSISINKRKSQPHITSLGTRFTSQTNKQPCISKPSSHLSPSSQPSRLSTPEKQHKKPTQPC